MGVRRSGVLRRASVVVAALATLSASRPVDKLSVGSKVLLHAHNCYPDEGRWSDRLDRALATAPRPIVIEQDLVWDARGRGRSLVSHGTPIQGNEPTLEDHFFRRITPIVEAAIAENRRETWPVIVLHLDFKTNEPAHHRAIWDLLGRYESWLAWVPRVENAAAPQPFRVGPLLVLTEQGEGQESTFHDRVPIGTRLRLFGTVAPTPRPSTGDREADLRAAAAASPSALIPSGATNYRRWTNQAWAVVEEGGPPRAGTWTAEDATRLTAIVRRSHELGLWLRFYALNGHAVEADRGWSAGYNFGSLDAARARWRAAIAAGVDFVATDQYEEFAAELARQGTR